MDDMNIDELAREARSIWGDKRMTLDEIVVVLGVVYGDLCRQARALQEGGAVNEAELKKELGNVIFSAVRWCADLGLDPNDCIAAARTAQTTYAAKLNTSSTS